MIEGMTYAVFLEDEGKEFIFTRQKMHDYFGELSAFDGQARSLTVYAKNKAHLIAMSARSFKMLIQENPIIQERVILDMVRRIRTLSLEKTELANQSVDMRLRSYLARLALDAQKFVPGGVIDDAPTHAEVAASIGANREAVKRAMSHLKRAGVVETTRKTLTILDPDALLPA
jgi:CRP-like cAMP-binding protein